MMRSGRPSRRKLTHWQPQQWRWVMLVFFSVLMLPAVVLSAYSYRQLKWESLHRFQQFSAELSQRLDQQIQAWLAREEARPSTDYFFLGSDQRGAAKLLNRSPLSYLPLNSPWPGALGYFQVDSRGQVSTPLLPAQQQQLTADPVSGLDPLEWDQRLALNQQLFQVLAQNALAQPNPPPTPTVNSMAVNNLALTGMAAAGVTEAELAATGRSEAGATAAKQSENDEDGSGRADAGLGKSGLAQGSTAQGNTAQLQAHEAAGAAHRASADFDNDLTVAASARASPSREFTARDSTAGDLPASASTASPSPAAARREVLTALAAAPPPADESFAAQAKLEAAAVAELATEAESGASFALRDRTEPLPEPVLSPTVQSQQSQSPPTEAYPTQTYPAQTYPGQASVAGFQRLQEEARELRQRVPNAISTPAARKPETLPELSPGDGSAVDSTAAMDLAERKSNPAASPAQVATTAAKRSAAAPITDDSAQLARLNRPAPQPASKEKTEAPAAAVAALDLASFQQLLGRFQFTPLDSGHLLLFRQVNLAGQTYYQGLIIDRAAWVQQTIATEFYRSPWSAHSQLVLRHQEHELVRLGQRASTYSSRNSQDNPALARAAPPQSHYRNRLAAPFDLLSVDFELLTLPPSPGFSVLLWTAGAFVLALSLGCWMMYRAGLRQIALARQQENFIAAVSHELKTPLTSIRMYGEMLSAGWVGEDKRGQYYRFIQDEGERLSRLIDQVLQLAKLKRTGQLLARQNLSLVQVEQLFRAKIVPYLERQACHWHWLCPEELGQQEIQLDPDAMVQILLNLAENAVKFSAANGSCELRLHWSRHDKHLLLRVSDCGPGLNPRQLEQIFQPFFRGEDELQRRTQGTGLGLALVDQLCQAQGIQISAANRPATAEHPGGAEFTLRFA